MSNLRFLSLLLVVACADAAAPPDDVDQPEHGLGPGASLEGRRPFPADSAFEVVRMGPLTTQ